MVSIEVQADEKLHTACDECSKRLTKTAGEERHVLSDTRDAKAQMLGRKASM